MGADIIGWIGCPLQAKLGFESFLRLKKLSLMRRAVVDNVPEHERANVEVNLVSNHLPVETLTYSRITEELGDFELGIPECSSCLISMKQPLGCCARVRYPIDDVFETAVFNYVVSEIETHDSIPNQIYQDVFSAIHPNSPFHTNRGPDGTLAMLEKPLVHEWQSGGVKHRVDSAQILGGIFQSQIEPAYVVGYSLFWSRFMQYAKKYLTANSHTMFEASRIPNIYMPLASMVEKQKVIFIVDG